MANENPPPKKAASNLFIGFDISTQQVSNSSVVVKLAIKASILNYTFAIV